MHHTNSQARTSRILVSLMLFVMSCFSLASAQAKDILPISGIGAPEMEDFDEKLVALMKKWQVPGATVAIVQSGKLVYARGYGYSDEKKTVKMAPDAKFRIGSISKLLTAAAVLKLVQERKLDLDSSAFKLLNLPQEPDPSRRPDARAWLITVRNLLQGTGGWDRDATGDPMFQPIAQQAAMEYSNSMRPTPQAIIRYEACRRLDFYPGTKYHYSNLGFCMLGEIVRKISGRPYVEYVKDELLKPMQIDMVPGKTRVAAKGEVFYFPYDGEQLGPAIMPNVRGYVPLEYGGDFYLEAMTADCGWVGSSIDVANFVSCLFGEQGKEKQILSPDLVKLMLGRPKIDQWRDKDFYFGMGWEVRKPQKNQDLTIRKEGSLPGLTTTVVHKMDNCNLAIAFNLRPKMSTSFQNALDEFIETQLHTHRAWLKQQSKLTKK